VHVPSSLRAYLAEPAVPDPPRRVGRDWALVVVASLIAVLETALRNDTEWLAISPAWRWGELAVFFVAVPPALLIRRIHPLWALLVAFVPISVYGVIESQAEGVYGGLVTMAFALITVYTLFRWGSGRDGAVGLVVVISVGLIGLVYDPSSTLGDWIGGYIVLSLPVMIGLVVRYRGTARDRMIDAAKAHEREELARELHDTVAHHVSAIAIQAQAGRALAATDPQRALTVLQVIEEAASRTLADMRSMVGTLRDGAAELTPRQGVADLHALAHDTAGGPSIEVSVDQDLGEIGPAADAALYRIAQESITNALRHARSASTVTVRVDAASDLVRLTVRDDGEAAAVTRGEGYGLLGMAERAQLLGGTFTAGPDGRRGWRVEAELPRWT
jgi:signal transduction histidine kinase